MKSRFYRGAVRFLKLWLLMSFSFIPIRLGYNLAFYGWLDLRRFALLELLVIPLGQAAVFFLVTAPFALKTKRT